ncbi:hypothetical protein [Sphingobium yanoikuyae]|uniref:hypothetical protein n=1 Tax=Sphingobium yanoikuyae TaxID=13690 RepID=UPI0013785987|nr:hypothetical protein [Sphingobium yanoikuyae]NBB38650.1 hypothetical protein [Sphingobium yanoikuyae]
MAVGKRGAPQLGKRPMSWHDQQMEIAFDFGGSLEHTGTSVVRDANELAHPKPVIFNAILYAIGTAENRELAELFSVSAICLADYQHGVGEPVIIPDFPDVTDQAQLQAFAKSGAMERLSYWMDKAQAEGAANHEWVRKAKAANRNINNLPKWLWTQYRQGGLSAAYRALSTGRAPIPLPPQT